MSEIIHSARVSEIGGVGGILSIEPDLAQSVIQDDQEPQFVTVEIESGWSKNKRYWPTHVLERIAAQVNEKHPVGYQGHYKDEERGTILPDPQTIWLKAITTGTDKGKKLIVKGYNLPGAKVREWAKRGAVNSVSVFGNADLERTKDGWKVNDIDLESIDWSRKFSEGMNTRLVSVTAEMKGEDVEPKEIGKLTLEDLSEHNPSLVALIEDKAAGKNNEKVTEMESENKTLKDEITVLDKLRDALGVDKDGDPVKALGEIMDRVTAAVKSDAKKIVEKVLDSRFKDDRSKRLVTLAVGEMEQGEKSAEEFEAFVSEKIDKALEENEDIKELVSEMSNDENSNDENEKKDSSKSGGSPLSGHLKLVKEMGEKKENEFVEEEVITV